MISERLVEKECRARIGARLPGRRGWRLSFRPPAASPGELSPQKRSAFEGHAEKIALAPDQTAHAKRPEIVKGQRDVKRDDLQVLGAHARSEICDVANCTRMYTGLPAEEQQRAFGNFRSSYRSAVKRAFPLIKTILIFDHCATWCRKQSRPSGV